MEKCTIYIDTKYMTHTDLHWHIKPFFIFINCQSQLMASTAELDMQVWHHHSGRIHPHTDWSSCIIWLVTSPTQRCTYFVSHTVHTRRTRQCWASLLTMFRLLNGRLPTSYEAWTTLGAYAGKGWARLACQAEIGEELARTQPFKEFIMRDKVRFTSFVKNITPNDDEACPPVFNATRRCSVL